MQDTVFPAVTPMPPHTVCGRRITTLPEYYSPTAYQERMIYFCTEFCLAAFQADPDRFFQAHSRCAHLVQQVGDI